MTDEQKPPEQRMIALTQEQLNEAMENGNLLRDAVRWYGERAKILADSVNTDPATLRSITSELIEDAGERARVVIEKCGKTAGEGMSAIDKLKELLEKPLEGQVLRARTLGQE